jgi:hypothetical protein
MDISPTHHYARNDQGDGPARAAAENDPKVPRKIAIPQGRTKEEYEKRLQYQCRIEILTNFIDAIMFMQRQGWLGAAWTSTASGWSLTPRGARGNESRQRQRMVRRNTGRP